MVQQGGPPIESIRVRAYKVPTEGPESDGTLRWDSTTMVLVHLEAGGCAGMGYSYTHAAARELIEQKLADVVRGRDAFDVAAAWSAMVASVRNIGDVGLSRMAAAAVDNALWDLKARLLDLPLVKLFGQVHETIEAYGSGGFTSYTEEQLKGQLSRWADQGFRKVKMKIGRDPGSDPQRIRDAREAMDPSMELFVDANGAFHPKEALAAADFMADHGVTWYEEPVWHSDLRGLRRVRDACPPCMEVAVGEYGFDLLYFKNLISAGAVDVLQADATRCGISGFRKAAVLCEAGFLPMSSHTAPAIHLHVCCASPPVRHMEYFYDHVRIENMFFDGAPQPQEGRLAPDLSRPGMGLEFKESDAEEYRL